MPINNSSNRIKYRDIWDIVWLHGKGIKPRLELLKPKFQERGYSSESFLHNFAIRKKALSEQSHIEKEFQQEIHRFLPAQDVRTTIGQANFWPFIVVLFDDLYADSSDATLKRRGVE